MHQNKSSNTENSSKKIEKNALKSQLCNDIFNETNTLQAVGNKMWSNTRTCVNFVSVFLQNNTVRGFKTAAVCNAAKSVPADPGYASEDKILQIKQHQNDYAQQYPSVTLILNKTMTDESRAALEKWKQERIAEMGQEEFDKFYQGKIPYIHILAYL